ncbi:MAG TPA: hypothetical protein VLI04_17310 [Nocardioidaceae bacterium]|nr:hypothetical protein [Nocardioidaceae bacterium]
MRVVVRWDEVANAEPMLREVVREVVGYDPGPVHHTCPHCGSIEHGRPYVDAPVAVSVAHTAGLTMVAVSSAGPVGVDVEADAAPSWVQREAVGKAHGVGLVGEELPETWVADLAVEGFVAAVALVNGAAEVQAAPRRTTTAGTGPTTTHQ